MSATRDDAVNEGTPRYVVEELLRRQQVGGEPDIDDLVASDMINHAAGLQGRDGLQRILRTIENDLGPLTYDQHHLIAQGDLVTQHVTAPRNSS